jgi:DNA-binding response OmpR family regulator
MANILLIEPDRLLAETYKRSLEKVGHEITTCAGAQSGVISADKLAPDLVILELQLVEHSGIEFLYEFRSYSDWQAIPVLVHTMVPKREFNTSWHLLHDELGVRGYLYKPDTDLGTLLDAVSDLIPIRT